MASKESNEVELTFIRCPSCKSLMPSTAHKCGMCGLSMDDEESIPTEKKLRLRQRTTSDIGDIAEAMGSETIPEENNLEDSSLEPDTYSGEDEDIEDYDGDAQYSDDSDDDEVNDHTEDESSDQDSESEDSSGEPARKRKRRRKKKKKSQVFESQSDVTQDSEEQVEAKGGFNWGSRESTQEYPPRTLPSDSQKVLSDVDSSELETAKIQVEYPKIEIPPVQKSEPQIEKTENRENFPNKNVNKGATMNEGNKLLGWFVNYSTDSNGKYFEIRVGKKFIGRQELRPHDLIIPDSAISTPHCLLNAEGGKLGLQDLMSDQGTFVKYAGDKDFTKIDSSAILKHGDILRLGTYELIVCLVPTI